MLGFQTSREVWSSLDRNCSLQSQARVFQLRFDLMRLSKGTLKMHEYYHKPKSIGDTLVVIGQPMSNDDLVNAILIGLGPEYQSFATSITTRSDPVNLDIFYNYLLTLETQIEHQQSIEALLPQVNAAFKNQPSKPNSRLCGTQSNSNNYSYGGYSNIQSNRGRDFRDFYNNQGSCQSSSQFFFNKRGVFCQLCNHTIWRSFFFFS